MAQRTSRGDDVRVIEQDEGVHQDSERTYRRQGPGLVGLLVLAALATGCSKKGSKSEEEPPREVVVMRVEAPSAEEPGAVHCNESGKDCRPLAPKQRLPAKGLVRTYAGGKVTLDFGAGRRVDLGSLSETKLSPGKAQLVGGEFSLESTPLVTKDDAKPLVVDVGGQKVKLASDASGQASFSVQGDEALMTLRYGGVDGVDGAVAPHAGDTVRLTAAGAFRTSDTGGELPALASVAPPSDDLRAFLTEMPPRGRGLGTMTARLPNTDQVREGVHLTKHRVRVVIRDGFARTEVEEEFENSTPHVLEGRYRFPVPGNASLSRLALWVGDELIEGEVLERGRAARIYSAIVDQPAPRDPALLEWVTGGEMSLKVFPIMPKKSRRVVLAYNEALSTEGGLMRYVYPLSLGEGRETPIGDLSIEVRLEDRAGRLLSVRAPSHDAAVSKEGATTLVRYAKKGALPHRDFVVAALTRTSRDAVLATDVAGESHLAGASGSSLAAGSSPAAGSPAAGRPTLTQPAPLGVPATPSRPLAEVKRVRAPGVDGYFALRVSADLEQGATRPAFLASDRAIIVDVSHSQSPETIRAQAALAYGIVREMEPSERFVLLACDSACDAHAPRADATPDARRQEAKQWLGDLRPGGSSDMAGALVAAAQHLERVGTGGDRRRQVVVLGDGQATAGELSAQRIAERAGRHLQKIDAEVRLVGAGRTVDDSVLRGLAAALDATYEQLQGGAALEARIAEVVVGLRRPVIRQPRLSLPTQLRINRLPGTTGENLPALRLGEEFVVTGELLGQATGELVLEGTIQGKPYRLTRAIAAADGAPRNPLVPRLWARDRIQQLEGEPETASLRAEIVALSRQHRTMSRYTSFLVLESEKMYRDFGVGRTTKSVEDQDDASFGFEDNRRGARLAEKSSEARSFDDLEGESPQRASATQKSGGSAPSRPVLLRPKPSTKKRASKGMFGDEFDESSSGSLGASPSASKSKTPSAPAPRPSVAPREEEIQRILAPEDTWEPPPVRWRPPPRPRIRRARLTHVAANDEWRRWGDRNMERLAESLAADGRSRQRQEAYIRGALQHGRFAEARRTAQAFFEMDPDYRTAAELLSWAAVTSGDHELARRMLDVSVETAARSAESHAQAARAFEAVGDTVRACAHYRSLSEIAPHLTEATWRAESCWASALGETSEFPAPDADEGKAGQYVIEVVCDAGVATADCPSPVVIAPDGRIVSPWTPGVGKTSRQKVTFVKLRSGNYWVMVMGGAPAARGHVKLVGRSGHESKTFSFDGGGLATVAKTQVAFW